MLEVYDGNNKSTAPEWVTVDIFQKTATLIMKLVPTNIKLYSLIFCAKLAPYSISDVYNSNYSTDEIEVKFLFPNKQWILNGYNSSKYLVVGEMTVSL